jgi:uncharacterized protein
MSPEETATVSAFLDSYSTLTLATHGPDGPWAATVFYAHDAGLNLYFISGRTTRHVRDLLANPEVAATVTTDFNDWESIRGLQIAARAERVGKDERYAITELYLKKFPSVAQLQRAPQTESEEKIAKGFAASDFFRLRPQTIRLVDNTQRFGHKVEFTLPH